MARPDDGRVKVMTVEGLNGLGLAARREKE
jgi:hypothetical protein